MVFCINCIPTSGSPSQEASSRDPLLLLTPQTVETQDFFHLQHLVAEREHKLTLFKGAQAGLVAGLSVMMGGALGGPIGAVVGGGFAMTMAAHVAKDVVSLHQMLQDIPPERRNQVLQMSSDSFRREFTEAIEGTPELRLLSEDDDASILGMMRYGVDRHLFKDEQLERVDGILRKVYKIQIISMG